MLKRYKWAFFLSVMLLGWLLCGCGGQKEAQYVFPEMPTWDKEDPEGLVWVKGTGGMQDGLYLYSIPEQEILESYRPKCKIRDYAATDTSVYFTTEWELWRIDRTTKEMEKMQTDSCYRLAVHDGYLFFGNDNEVFVCPQEGDPETDAVSLNEQFPQTDKSSWGERKEIVFQGWRIGGICRRDTYDIWDIVDEKSGEVIIGPKYSYYFYSHGGPPDFTGRYIVRGEGEWITFDLSTGTGTKGGPVTYQRDGVEESCSVSCLAEKKYCYSRIGEQFIAEGGKLTGYITVCYGPLLELLGRGRYDEAYYDVLFELDIEAGTSRILYSMEENKARIVGYKSGKVYFFLDGRIYRESLADGTREKVIDMREGEWAGGWDDKHNSIDSLDIYWQGDYLILYMDREIKSYYIPD